MITVSAPTVPETLVTAEELAARLGLRTAQQVLDLRRMALDFPEPVGRRRRAFVWSWPAVRRWGLARAGLLVGAVGVTVAAAFEQLG